MNFFRIGVILGSLFWIAFTVTNIAAWITHVVITIQAEQWVLLVVGAIFFPIGLIHGWGSWFGLF